MILNFSKTTDLLQEIEKNVYLFNYIKKFQKNIQPKK